MNSSSSASVSDRTAARELTILLYSSDRGTRDAVRLGVGSRPAADVIVEQWAECATPAAAEKLVSAGGYDLLILDGEAQPYGGMGLCRQFKDEIFDCPPVLLLTARKEDAWLAAWSLADGIVSKPLDASVLAEAVVTLARA